MIPGPDSLYVLGRTAMQGWRSGMAAAWGISAGTLVHIFAAALGLSALLATSTMAFTVLKILGAVYLVYMGCSMLFSRPVKSPEANAVRATLSLPAVFAQGFLTNALNPKVALFFLAFVPQFISPGTENTAQLFIYLGVIFNIGSLLWLHFLVLVLVMLRARNAMGNLRGLPQLLKRVAGGLFIYFAARLLLTEAV